ncbi:MAG TPA: helix-turn-helix domain-containing protein [Baekduia sp.]|nr:helix-turn-helix domain-containing protein [Baekduia sp.]
MTRTRTLSVPQADGAALSIMREVLTSLIREDETERTLDLICRRVCELESFKFCGVLLPDADWSHLQLAANHQVPSDYVERLRELFLIPIGDQAAGSPTRAAVETRSTVVIEDTHSSDSFRSWRELAVEFGYRSIVSVPLLLDDQVIGVLNGYSAEPRTFTQAQLGAIETLAAHAALSLRVTMLIDARQDTIARLRDSNAELERQRSVLERAHAIHQRLTKAVIKGTDFEGLAQELSALIDRAVAVTDATGRVLCTATGPDKPQLAALLAESVPRLRERLAAGGGAELPAESSEIVGQIRVGAERLGYVVVPAGDDHSRELDVRAVEHATTVLALEIVKERVARATEDRLRADFLSDLVYGHESDADRLRERARLHGLSLADENRVIALALGGDARSDPPDLFATVTRELAAGRPGTLVGMIGETITAVVPVNEEYRSLDEAVAAARQALSPKLTLSAAIGRPATDAVGLVSSHQDARLCLDLLTRIGRQGTTLVRDDLGILGLFVDHNRPEELVTLAHRTLGPVLARDEGRENALIQTLDAYLEHGCDARAAAAVLFVHVNTVKYRLKRIEELCDLDLRVPEHLLEATIASLALKLLR